MNRFGRVETYDPAIIVSFQTGAWGKAVEGATKHEIAAMTTRAQRVLAAGVRPGQNATHCVCVRLIRLAYLHNGWDYTGTPLHAVSYHEWRQKCGHLGIFMRQLAMQLFMQVHSAEWNLHEVGCVDNSQ
jgi:hypothetical protein